MVISHDGSSDFAINTESVRLGPRRMCIGPSDEPREARLLFGNVHSLGAAPQCWSPHSGSALAFGPATF